MTTATKSKKPKAAANEPPTPLADNDAAAATLPTSDKRFSVLIIEQDDDNPAAATITPAGFDADDLDDARAYANQYNVAETKEPIGSWAVIHRNKPDDVPPMPTVEQMLEDECGMAMMWFTVVMRADGSPRITQKYLTREEAERYLETFRENAKRATVKAYQMQVTANYTGVDLDDSWTAPVKPKPKPKARRRASK